MSKSVFDILASPVSAPLDAAAGATHAVSNALGGIPGIGGLFKYGGIGLSDFFHAGADTTKGDFHQAGKDMSSSLSNAIHGPNTIPVVGPYILPAVAGFFGGPLGYGAAAGIQHGFESSRNGANFGQAALGGAETGALSAAGSYAGGQVLGPQLSGIGTSAGGVSGGTTTGFLGTPLSQSLSDTALSGIGDALGSQTPANILGSAAGAHIGEGIANSLAAQPDPLSLLGPSFTPLRLSQMDTPPSLSQFSSLDPAQQATNIASRGVYGKGNGPQEQNYFLNLINRQLFDPSGNVAANTNGLAPVDMTYLNQLGISGSTPTDYLQGISKFGT